MTVTTSVPKAPRPDTRETRALELFRARGREISLVASDVYLVPSCFGERTYRVDYAEETCECPDFTIPRPGREAGAPCKHVYAVGILRAKRRGQSARRTPDHELIRRDAAAHPDRLPSEHEAAARAIAGRTYVEDLSRISLAAQAALSRDLEAEELGL